MTADTFYTIALFAILLGGALAAAATQKPKPRIRPRWQGPQVSRRSVAERDEQ